MLHYFYETSFFEKMYEILSKIYRIYILFDSNIDISYIKNKYTDTQGSFGHVLEVEIKSSGDFKDMVKFLNILEQNTLVTDIYSSRLMGSDEGITSDINISVWGINH